MADSESTGSSSSVASSWFANVPKERLPLATALADKALETAARLQTAQMSNLPLGEESITDALLIDLKAAVPGLEIRSLTRHQEAREGADWEFWIEGNRQWFAFLVQAKKAKRSRSAPGVTYDIGYSSGNAKTPQVDLLAQASAVRGMPAIYAFYNDPFLTNKYIRAECQSSGVPVGLDGISTMSVGTASWLFRLGWDRPVPVDTASSFTFPWSCLAACPVANMCLSKVPPNTANDPESLGFAPDTVKGDLALDVARAVHQIEKAHWAGTFAIQTTAKANGWGVWNTAPAYVPRIDQDSGILAPYPEDEFPAPRYIVSLGRQVIHEWISPSNASRHRDE